MLRAYARTGTDPVLTPSVVTPDDGVLARVDSSAAARELARALATLSAGDRDVLLLIAWADLS